LYLFGINKEFLYYMIIIYSSNRGLSW